MTSHHSVDPQSIHIVYLTPIAIIGASLSEHCGSVCVSMFGLTTYQMSTFKYFTMIARHVHANVYFS